MAQSVSELPNQNFISYLSKYGLNSNLQFDEYVSKAARDLNIRAFDFNLPLLESYREEIKRAIASNHSTLILLTGRAGDGKTHFFDLCGRLPCSDAHCYNTHTLAFYEAC